MQRFQRNHNTLLGEHAQVRITLQTLLCVTRVVKKYGQHFDHLFSTTFVINSISKVCWYFIFNKVVQHVTYYFVFQIPRILGDALGKISARNKEYGAQSRKLIFFSANSSCLKPMNVQIHDNFICILPFI